MQAFCRSCLTSCSMGWTILENHHPSQNPLLSMTIFHGIFPSEFLNRTKSALLKFRIVILLFVPSTQDPEFHCPMVTAGKAAPSLHVSDQFSFVCTYQVQQQAFPLVSSSTSCVKGLPMLSRNSLACLHSAVLPFQHISGWFKSPCETRARKHKASSNCLKNVARFFPIRWSVVDTHHNIARLGPPF